MRSLLAAMALLGASAPALALDIGFAAGLNFFGEDKNASVQELRLRSGSFWTPTSGLQFRFEGGIGRMESRSEEIWRLSAGPVAQLRPSGAGWMLEGAGGPPCSASAALVRSIWGARFSLTPTSACASTWGLA